MARPSHTFHVSALDASITVRAPSKAKVKTLATMLQDVLTRHPERLKGTGKKPVKRTAAKKPAKAKKSERKPTMGGVRAILAKLPKSLRNLIDKAEAKGVRVDSVIQDSKNARVVFHTSQSFVRSVKPNKGWHRKVHGTRYKTTCTFWIGRPGKQADRVSTF